MKMKIKSKSSSTIVVSISTPPCPTPPPPHQWQSILLPLIAGVLHARVFYHATFGCILRDHNNAPPAEFRRTCFLLDSAIFVAYAFDLICCLCFKVIPFSRFVLLACRARRHDDDRCFHFARRKNPDIARSPPQKYRSGATALVTSLGITCLLYCWRCPSPCLYGADARCCGLSIRHRSLCSTTSPLMMDCALTS